MRIRFVVLMITAVLVACISASAQSENSQEEDNPRQLAARCAYTQSEDSCGKPSSSRQETDDQIAQAQFPARGPRFGPPQMPHPYGRSPFAYGPYDNGRRAAVGGLIGFGAGFALGTGANHTNTRVASGLIVGVLGAAFGAAIGHGIATFPHASFHRRRPWPDEGDEEASSSTSSHAASGRDARQSPQSGN